MIVIVNYGIGNLGSIANMLKKIGAKAVISSDPKIIAGAEKLILPGVGAFDHAMRSLTESGLIPVLERKVIQDKTPILGLCLGMQLLGKRSEEGQLPGLGWIDAETVRFKFDQSTMSHLKVPHMGWNELEICQSHPLFAGLETPRFYFVHSYHVLCDNQENILAIANYGYGFTSAIGRENILGVQFHPEKSHRFGMQLLKNYAERV
jgi:glutamine amidotransferase